jgi:hypothetical protein
VSDPELAALEIKRKANRRDAESASAVIVALVMTRRPANVTVVYVAHHITPVTTEIEEE